MRSINTSPAAVVSTTEEICSVSLRRRVIGTLSRLSSHATRSVAAGLPVPAPFDVLARLMPAFAEYRAIWATQGFGPIRERWLEHAAGVGDRIVVRLGVDAVEGRFEGLKADGALALRLDDGSLRSVHAGEVFAL